MDASMTARELLTLASVEISEPHDPIQSPYWAVIHSKNSRLSLSMGSEVFDDFIVSFIDKDATVLVRQLLRRLIEEKARAQKFYRWYKEKETEHINLLQELSDLTNR